MEFYQDYVWGGHDLSAVDGFKRVVGYDIKVDSDYLTTLIDTVPASENAKHLVETVKQEIALEDLCFSEDPPQTEVELLARKGEIFAFRVNGRKIDCDSVQIWRETPKDPPRMDIRGVYIDKLRVEVGDSD